MVILPSRFRLKRSILAFLAVAAFAVVIACGESSVEPTQVPTGIVFDKQSVTIDGVMEGQEVTQTFLVMNRTLRPVIVKSVEVLDASECDEVLVPQSTFVVPPEGISVLSVRMRGHEASASPHTVSLALKTMDGGDTEDRLAITFRQVTAALEVQSGPRLGVDRNTVDIGDIPYDWPMHEKFVLFNYGDQPLQLDGVPLVRVLEGC